MKKKYKYGFILVLFLGVVLTAVLYLHGRNIPVLEPKGPIAERERQLIIVTASLSLIVVVPVFTLLFGFAWKYRASNTKATYTPDWDHSRVYETIWWTVPSALILVLGIIIWNSTHSLDPYKPLNSLEPPITIQVVALDWKWLFIYPQQNIASVNFVQFPTGTPVNFELTADAPMNSFWIPQLAGQIYAMPGMSTQLHLMASVNGSFNGSSANISGDGFAGMTFIAKSTSQTNFEKWVNSAKQSSASLSQTSYDKLVRPSENNQVAYYSSGEPDLYDKILQKYMAPIEKSPTNEASIQTQTGGGMNMNMQGVDAQ